MKGWIVVGCVLTLAPILAFALDFLGLLPAEGGHGLGEWYFESVCFVVLCIGTLASAFLARKGSRAAWVTAVVGAAAMLVFLARFGIPFRR